MPTTPHTYALTDLTTVKEALGIVVATDDNLLTRLINSVTDYIENTCGRRFADTTYTDELYSGDADFELILKQYPLTATQAVSVKVADVLLAAADYYTIQPEGVLHKNSGWTRGIQNIKVTYSAGFAVIPSDLEQACIELVGLTYKRGKNAELRSETIGSYAVTYADIKASPVVAQTLELYKKEFLA